MQLPSQDQFDSLETIRDYFAQSAEALLLLDRRGRVHLASPKLEEIMERPNAEIIEKTFGVALGCIHTGDHPDGCMYGSICGDCFLHVAFKQGLKTRHLVENQGILAVGLPEKGVTRPTLTTTIIPWFDKRRLYLIMGVAESPAGD